MKTILVAVAHPDDEALGCGGTIARHVSEGDIVYVVFMADGVTSRTCSSDQDLNKRNADSAMAAKILGVKQTFMLGFPDNRMDSLDLLDIVQSLESVIDKIKPDVIYTHHSGDLNHDHRITHQAVMTACRPIPGCHVREIYSFEVMSSTEWESSGNAPFLPNTYVDISSYLEQKICALEAYSLEMRAVPHSRSLEHMHHLARHRGHSVGLYAAEAFVLIRFMR